MDDILIACKDVNVKNKLFDQMNTKFSIRDMGSLHYYLGINIKQTHDEIVINQHTYTNQLLAKFNMKECNPSRIPMETTQRLRRESNSDIPEFPYRELVGSLMYLVTSTRPDLAYAVGQLSRFVSCYGPKHVGAAKRVLRYLKGTRDMSISYQKTIKGNCEQFDIDGFSDSDWGTDPDTRKSISDYTFTLNGGAITWASRRQTVTAQSSAEAEYVAASEACMDGKSILNILQEIFLVMKD